MVIKGQLSIHLKDRTIELNEGEMYIVPKGMEHKPEAKEECWILLFEPKQTAHTGEVVSDLTKTEEDWI